MSAAERVAEEVRAYADLLSRTAGQRPEVVAVDVAWKLRQILGDPNVGVPDAQVTSGAPVRVRYDVIRAKQRLYARLIANAHRLDTPFSDAPDQSPWMLLKRDMAALDAALQAEDGAR